MFGRFFKSVEKFGRIEPGAGELGPLEGACSIELFLSNPKRQQQGNIGCLQRDSVTLERTRFQ